MPFVDDLNLTLRDHQGYTGDGHGGVGELPVGDRSTARKEIDKRDLREILILMAQTMGDPSALYDIIGQVANKAEQGDLDAEALARIAGQTALRTAIKQSGVYHLVVQGGSTANAVIAEMPTGHAGHALADGEMVSLAWPALTTAANPTLTIGGVTYGMRGQRGGAIPSGRIEAGQGLTLIKSTGNILRAINALDKTEIGLFNVDNTADVNKPLSTPQAAAIAPIRDAARGATNGAGELVATSSNFYQMLAGATEIVAGGGRRIGFDIPSGQTGIGTFVIPRIQIPAKRLAQMIGYTLRLVTIAEISAGFLAEHPVQGLVRVDHQGGSPATQTAAGALESETIEGNYLRRTHLYTITGTEDRVGPTVQVAAASVPGTAPHSLRIVSLTYQVALDAQGKAVSAADVTRIFAAEDEAAPLIGVATLAASGMQAPAAVTGTVQSAVSAADGRPNRLAYVQMGAGRYAEHSIDSDGQVVLAGRGRHRTTLDGSLPDTASAAEVAATSTIDAHRGTVVIRDQTVIMTNGRYAYHADDHVANARIVLKNSTFLHRGNAAAGWVSQNAVGHGSWSGSSILIEDCILSAPRAGLQYHNNAAFTHPSEVIVRRSQLIARNLNSYAVIVEPLGSGVQDHLVIEDCSLVGNVFVNVNQWFGAAGYQPANHAAEILVTGKGNSPAVAHVADFGRALRITSATIGAGSTVAIGGAAAALLFGDAIHGRDGAVGVAGSRWGDLDINGTVLTGPAANIKCGLGPRLGNRAALGAVALTVTIDGTERTVSFTGDYSASSNATILGLINAAISGLGTASEYAPGNRVRPVMTDEEEHLCNTSGTYIPWMSALCWDGSRRNIRMMVEGDAFHTFAGMCFEPDGVYPGDFGRVKRRGWISRQDLIDAGRENGGPAVLYGEWYVPHTVPGMVDANAAPAHYTDGILRCVRRDSGQPNSWTALELRGTP